jgi:predicted acyl esterase
MDDGTALRADLFRPEVAKQYPVIMGAAPYWKWLLFHDDVWDVSRLRICVLSSSNLDVNRRGA